MRKIDYIAIHCTATSQDASVKGILNYWKNNLGWSKPGYHRLIKPNGEIVELLPFDQKANGVRGYNSRSIHISYIGGKDGIDDRTELQKAAILDCIYEAVNYKGVHDMTIIQGHRDFPGVQKYCPSFDAKKEYKWVLI